MSALDLTGIFFAYSMRIEDKYSVRFLEKYFWKNAEMIQFVYCEPEKYPLVYLRTSGDEKLPVALNLSEKDAACPCIYQLNFIKCIVPSVKGDIILEISKANEQIDMSAIIPAHKQAEVYLPLINQEPPQNTKYAYTLTDGYAKFVLTEGI